MLTRLKVSGFKNLVDADIHFGPFTCFAGPNGVGKSNLFDAIRFLSALADKTFIDAAKSVRDESGRTGDIRALFHCDGGVTADRMRFEAEMIVPPTGVDELGITAYAQTTFLRYTVELGYREGASDALGSGLELLTEELTYVKTREVDRSLNFPLTDEWKHTVVRTHREPRRSAYISTDGEGSDRKVYLHADGSSKKLLPRPAGQLPRTVLSVANATESPTALLARQEMQSWRLLQLEPTALRKPSEFLDRPRLEPDGSHLPATLYRLAKGALSSDPNAGDSGRVYERVAARLQELIQDVRAIEIDRDEKRLLLTLIARDKYGTTMPARGLSDGTLRFLALAVLEEDPEALGVICFEEPENGIHPDRIPAMIKLLKDIAVDPQEPVGDDNPLRQVIVNSHSPKVVQQLADDEVLVAMTREMVVPGGVTRGVAFYAMTNTWRDDLKPKPPPVPPGMLLPYLSGEAMPTRPAGPVNGAPTALHYPRRVLERPEIRTLFDSVADAQ